MIGCAFCPHCRRILPADAFAAHAALCRPCEVKRVREYDVTLDALKSISEAAVRSAKEEAARHGLCVRAAVGCQTADAYGKCASVKIELSLVGDGVPPDEPIIIISVGPI